MARFFIKKIKDKPMSKYNFINDVFLSENNNNEIKKEKVMNTKEKIELAKKVIENDLPKVKKLKREKGLIEKTESSITILTEDNKELLKD